MRMFFSLLSQVVPNKMQTVVVVPRQELCLECYRTTGTIFEARKVPPAQSEGAFELLEHRKRQRAATLTQRAWVRFQYRVS